MRMSFIFAWLLLFGLPVSAHELVCEADGEMLRFQGISDGSLNLQKQEYLDGVNCNGQPLRAQLWQVSGQATSVSQTSVSSGTMVELIFLKGQVNGTRRVMLVGATSDHPVLHAKGKAFPCRV